MRKKRKKNPQHEIRELILWAENSSKLHNQFTSIIKNLERKYKRGIYDPVLAAKLWKYWIDEAVKDYNKEILGGGYSLKQNVFTVQDRKDAAIEVEKQNRDDIKRGDNPMKKKRSAKQLANDKRLGRLAKKRAAAKRGTTRKKVTKKKTTRRANPKRTTRAKSHLWLVFRTKGKQVHFLTGYGAWSVNKGSAAFFQTKPLANKALGKDYVSGYQHGIAPANKTATQIHAAVSGRASSARGKA